MATDQAAPAPSLSERIASIDVFRGLTMLVMLFANDINDDIFGGIKDSPWWLHHMPPAVDGMTMNDVIFPAFLFIVGLSIPIALERRIARGDSPARLCGHILLRSLEMIFIGICMVNMYAVNEAATGMSGALWRLLLLGGIILLWNRYPTFEGVKGWPFIALRLAAAGLLIYLLVIFRGNLGEDVVWLRPRWWGIIGLIGWTYLVAALIWMAGRDVGVAIMGAMGLLIAVRIGDHYGYFSWWKDIFQGYLIGPGSLAGHASAVVGGLAIATLFRPNSPTKTPLSRIVWILVFAAGFAAAAFFLRPLLGIHKNSATPSWALYCLAIACAIYAFLYWLIDVKKITRWTAFLGAAGSNTLLMYLLPFIMYSALTALKIDFLQTHFSEGWLGVARSAVLAGCFVAMTTLLTRCRIRLQL
jgi:heparan-alpha-glucosaminide N-acetyltransferase